MFALGYFPSACTRVVKRDFALAFLTANFREDPKQALRRFSSIEGFNVSVKDLKEELMSRLAMSSSFLKGFIEIWISSPT